MKLTNSIVRLRALATLTVTSMLLVSTAYAITYKSPIIVDDNYVLQNGSVITDNYQGTATQPAITIKTSNPVTINNSNLIGPGDLIYAEKANVTVTNTTGIGTNPNVAGTQKGMFLHAESPINISVKNCRIMQTRYAVYVNKYTGNFTTNQTIKILNNTISNMDARPSNGSNDYSASGSFAGDAIQLQSVQGVPGIEIAWNQIINQPYQSQVQINLELTSSSGTAASHLLIHDNYLQGAYPTVPGKDSYSGGAVLMYGAATDTAATTTAFVDIYKNQIVSSGNHGMAIAAGHDINVNNNRIISSGTLPDCTTSTLKGAVGVYNWNYLNSAATVFFNNHVHDNLVGLVGINTAGARQRNDVWLPGQNNQMENNAFWSPNNATSPSVADEANEYQLWLQKVSTNSQKIGAQDQHGHQLPAMPENNFSDNSAKCSI